MLEKSHASHFTDLTEIKSLTSYILSEGLVFSDTMTRAPSTDLVAILSKSMTQTTCRYEIARGVGVRRKILLFSNFMNKKLSSLCRNNGE